MCQLCQKSNQAVVCYKIVSLTRRSEKYENPKKNKNASSIFLNFRRVRFSANSEIFFLKSNMADAGMSEGMSHVFWLS